MQRRDNMPARVYWALWGVSSRRAAVGYLLTSMVLCLAGLALYAWTRHWVLLCLLIAPLGYVQAIRWMDQNEGWEKSAP